MKCLRCGQLTERYTVEQRYCPVCKVEVAALLAAQEQRAPRFPQAKDLTGMTGIVL